MNSKLITSVSIYDTIGYFSHIYYDGCTVGINRKFVFYADGSYDENGYIYNNHIYCDTTGKQYAP